MTAQRVIKRYSNRKLYDTSKSIYVTLAALADLIRAGEDLLILDNASGEDITSRTLAQVLLGEERARQSYLSIKNVRELIKSSGEILQKRLDSTVANLRGDAGRTMSTIRTEAEKRVAEIRGDAERKLEHLRGPFRYAEILDRLDQLEQKVAALEAAARKKSPRG